MIKNLGRIITIFTLTLVLNFVPAGTIVALAEVNYNINIPSEAIDFVEANYQDMLSASADYYDSMEADSVNEYTLAKPFIICDNDSKYQDEIYYFPVLDGEEIVIVISVMNTSSGWNISASDELVEIFKRRL